MNFQIRNFMLNSRILFVIDGCEHCAKWKSVVDRINIEVPVNKRIRVIDCTSYNLLGITNNPLIRLFDQYLSGYPSLFYNKAHLEGANSKEEVEAFIRSALHDDFIVPRYNGLLFNLKCKFKKTIFGKNTILCNK